MQQDLSRLLRILPEAAFLADTASTLLAVNDALVQMSGLGVGRLVGHPLEALVADPAEKVRGYLRQCARSSQCLPGALRWRKADGGIVEVRCDGGLLAPRNGTEPAVIFVRCRPKAEANEHFTLLNRKIDALSREVFERKRAEQQRDELLQREHQARLEAERLGRVKDEFLATLSHELRTPIHAILGWVHLLLKPDIPAAQREAALRTIERNARAQSRIIDELLDMSCIVSGKVQLQVQPVPLPPLVEAAIESLRPAAQAKSLQLETRLGTAECMVQGDPYRLQQVVWNLLSNAIKFTPRHGQVRVQLEASPTEARLLVSDSGEGIVPDFLPHVFDRFRQADASITRRHGGLGLGLSIVKQIVELHGGTVQVDSPGAGRGTVFTVTLARRAQGAVTSTTGTAAVPLLKPPPGRPDSPPTLAGLHVLVVDDDADGREMVQVLLQSHHAIVSTAASAREALELVRTQHPHLLLCDIGMPDIDGCQLLASLRAGLAHSPGCPPAIALSAFAQPEDRARAMNAGFDGYLVKPVDISKLIAMLARFAPARHAQA